MPSNVRLLLTPLSVSSSTPVTEEAARRLKGARDSVQGLFDTLHAIRAAKERAGGSLRRLSHSEVDLLRAALVFAGAGLDAVLKQLLRDALPSLLTSHPSTHGQLKRYGVRIVDDEPKRAKKVLTDRDPTRRLRSEYVDELTKGSLQGHAELMTVRDALGLPDSGHFDDARLGSFADFFTARNQVVHELDLEKPSGPGTFTRRYRSMEESRDRADAALILAAQFVSAVDAL